MAEIVGVRFKNAGKVYYFSPGGFALEKGGTVVVETSRGIECGEVVIPNRQIADDAVPASLKPVLRPATEDDLRRAKDNAEKEKRAMRVCQEKIQAHKLDMKLVDVEYAFDGSKILFYFTSAWSRIWRRYSRPALSCGRSGCATKRRCSAGWVSADGRSAVHSSSAISSLCRSKWRKNRGCPSILPKFPAAAGG